MRECHCTTGWKFCCGWKALLLLIPLTFWIVGSMAWSLRDELAVAQHYEKRMATLLYVVQELQETSRGVVISQQALAKQIAEGQEATAKLLENQVNLFTAYRNLTGTLYGTAELLETFLTPEQAWRRNIESELRILRKQPRKEAGEGNGAP